MTSQEYENWRHPRPGPLTVDDTAEFTWSFGSHFLLQTNKGNFVWSDPEYGGDNTIKPFDGGYKEWCQDEHIDFGRSKGIHFIVSYCGSEVRILDV